MKLVRTIPRLGTFPELRVFYCSDCNEVETTEEREVAAQDFIRPRILA
jgi:hypothetical protein